MVQLTADALSPVYRAPSAVGSGSPTSPKSDAKPMSYLKVGRDIVGRIRVRCVSASNLAAVDRNLFRWCSDPYAVLYLRDSHNKQQSPQRHTHRALRTLNPRWKEDFVFSVRKRSATLTLHIDILHYGGLTRSCCAPSR